ncbi:MAG: hypothetical protein FJW40_08985 [Acidobacteria bacterium]|nr:hypothetical protein [Acidobacteriota bacterium]
MNALGRLKSPAAIQAFLDDLAYNKEPEGPTCKGPVAVLKTGSAHCMEGALVAALALRMRGHPALLVDLEAVRDDDHVLAVFKEQGHWGAIAKSNYAGLRFREPVYRTLRELALSYFEHYYNPAGEKTLRAFSRPVNLARFDRLGWAVTEDEVWYIPEHLTTVRHTALLGPELARVRRRMDPRSYRAGLTGSVEAGREEK